MSGWSFYALGTPASQGSKVRTKFGVREASKALAPWRDTVTSAGFGAGPCLDGPLLASVVFTFPRAKSAPKKKSYWADTAIDLDKADRAVHDAITAAGLWKDDARLVCHGKHAKVEVGHEWALPVPGVVVACVAVTDGWLIDCQVLWQQAQDAAWTKYRALAS